MFTTLMLMLLGTLSLKGAKGSGSLENLQFIA